MHYDMRAKATIIAIAALVVGVAIGWFAAGLRSDGAAPSQNGDDDGGVVATQKARSRQVPSAAKPTHKASICLTDSERMVPVDQPIEKPKENVEGPAAGNDTKPDNPFPRYLDMFKNNPEALVAEFKKEAEKDRAYQRELRDGTIDKLKLNEEQAAVFEKALDDLRDKITQHVRESVELITSGQLNDETAADGCIWDSNRILQYKMALARQEFICDTAEKLYEQLDLDGVSNADKQEFLFWAARQTSFSYECLEPNLSVYDKVYKNFGVGKGIFSWCRRPKQKK